MPKSRSWPRDLTEAEMTMACPVCFAKVEEPCCTDPRDGPVRTRNEPHVARTRNYTESMSFDVAALRADNARLRVRIRGLEDECNRWAWRWAVQGLPQPPGADS